MGDSWKERRWGDLATLEYGKGLRGYERGTGPYPVYGTNGPIGRHREPLCPYPGVIIGRKGAYRGVHYSKKPFFVIDTAFYLKPKTDIDLKWAYYQLLTQNINNMDSGSAIPSTSRDAFYNLHVKVPPLPEQKAIASIFGALDDKIELNRKINETLEAMAMAIFKSWFVDFDPVPGLGPHKEWQDSLLGRIPRGWKVGKVADLGEIICGKTPPTAEPENYGDDMPFITIPDMHGQVFVIDTAKKLSTQGVATQPNKTLTPLSICVSCIATPGLVALTSEHSQTNQQINSIIPYKDLSPYYCYMAFKELASEIKAHGSGGSVTLNLNKTQFSTLSVLLPDNSAIAKFHEVSKSIFNRILSNEKQSRTLATTRDVLLPKLLSGEIRVKDAERFVETAT
jgi:type I restriction enzyme S subunit